MRKGLEKERTEKRDVLCPIALDNTWKTKLDEELWSQLLKKNVLDFSKWREHDAFEAMFGRLFKGLKIYYPPKKD